MASDVHREFDGLYVSYYLLPFFLPRCSRSIRASWSGNLICSLGERFAYMVPSDPALRWLFSTNVTRAWNFSNSVARVFLMRRLKMFDGITVPCWAVASVKFYWSYYIICFVQCAWDYISICMKLSGMFVRDWAGMFYYNVWFWSNLSDKLCT